MKLAEADILILPAPGNADPAHWQRRWAERFATGRIVAPEGQERWQREPWIEAIHQAILMSTRPVVIVAHSLAVIALVHTAEKLVDTKVRGAFLAAPPDLEASAGPIPEAATHAPVPRAPLPFPSMLVASTTDPFCTLERAAELAAAWGSDFHVAGDAGHIDAASGHGPWPEGLLMFSRLMQRLKG